MPEPQEKQILIITHNHGGVSHAFAAALARTFSQYPYGQLVWHHMPTDDKNALLPVADRLENVGAVVWIDPDIVWNEEQFAEVVKPILSGLSKAAGCLHHATSRDASGGLYPVGLEFLPEDLDPLRGYVGPMRECDTSMYLRVKRMPFAFLAVSRDALISAAKLGDEYQLHNEGEKRTRRLFDARTDVDPGALVSEDHTACDYLRAVGVEIWVSMDHAVLRIVGGHTIGNPSEPPRIHEFAADAAKAKAK